MPGVRAANCATLRGERTEGGLGEEQTGCVPVPCGQFGVYWLLQKTGTWSGFSMLGNLSLFAFSLEWDQKHSTPRVKNSFLGTSTIDMNDIIEGWP